MTDPWTPDHTKLCNILAQLYLDGTNAERITVQAGMDPILLKFNDSAINNWFAIIKKADNQGLLPQLIKEALVEFPTNDTLKEALVIFEQRESEEFKLENAVSPKENARSNLKKEQKSGLWIGGNARIEGNVNLGDVNGDMNYKYIRIQDVGPSDQVDVNNQGDISHFQGIAGKDLVEVQKLFANIRADLEAQNLPDTTKAIGTEHIDQIEQEITKKDVLPDGDIIKIAGAWLLEYIPEIAGTLHNLFINSIVLKVVNEASEVASNWVQETFIDKKGV